MTITDKINAYVGRDVDFVKEVVLTSFEIEGGLNKKIQEEPLTYIQVWNIADKPAPSIKELQKLDMAAYQKGQEKESLRLNYETEIQQITKLQNERDIPVLLRFQSEPDHEKYLEAKKYFDVREAQKDTLKEKIKEL